MAKARWGMRSKEPQQKFLRGFAMTKRDSVVPTKWEHNDNPFRKPDLEPLECPYPGGGFQPHLCPGCGQPQQFCACGE